MDLPLSQSPAARQPHIFVLMTRAAANAPVSKHIPGNGGLLKESSDDARTKETLKIKQWD